MYAIKSVVVEKTLRNPPAAANEIPRNPGESVRTWVAMPREMDQKFHDLYCTVLLLTAR